jgi:hypothetical protein
MYLCTRNLINQSIERIEGKEMPCRKAVEVTLWFHQVVDDNLEK